MPLTDNFAPSFNYVGDLAYFLSYIDAMVRWRARKASLLTLLYPTKWQVESDHPSGLAMNKTGDAVTADFFSMIDVPFRFGSR